MKNIITTSLLTAAFLAAAVSPAVAQDVVYINPDCADTATSKAVCQLGRKPIALVTGNFLPAYLTVEEIEQMNPDIKNYLDDEGNILPFHFFRVG